MYVSKYVCLSRNLICMSLDLQKLFQIADLIFGIQFYVGVIYCEKLIKLDLILRIKVEIHIVII